MPGCPFHSLLLHHILSTSIIGKIQCECIKKFSMRFQTQLQKDVEPASFQTFTSPVSSLLSKISFEKGRKSQKAKNRMVWSNLVFPSTISVWCQSGGREEAAQAEAQYTQTAEFCRGSQWINISEPARWSPRRVLKTPCSYCRATSCACTCSS